MTEEKETKNDGENDEDQMKKKEVFEVGRVPLFHTKSPDHYQQSPWTKMLSNKNYGKTVYFWPEEELFSYAIDSVDYDVPEEVNSTNPGWTNLMSSKVKLRQEKRVHKKKKGEPGFKWLVGTEQKNTAQMRSLVQKLKKPGSLVVDARAETFSVSKACILPSEHRRFKG